MAQEKLLTVRDTSLILDISEKEVVDLAESGRLPAYKVGGVYLRFKQEQIEEFRKSLRQASTHATVSKKHSFKDRISDFFYFYDFYILSVLIILLMLFIIFKG